MGKGDDFMAFFVTMSEHMRGGRRRSKHKVEDHLEDQAPKPGWAWPVDSAAWWWVARNRVGFSGGGRW
jgi:hypothetical protein